MDDVNRQKLSTFAHKQAQTAREVEKRDKADEWDRVAFQQPKRKERRS